MNKQVKYTYAGANQDITQSKHQNTFYYDAEHIKIMATDTQSSGSVKNERGHELVISIPNITINQGASTVTYSAITESYTGGNEIDAQINATLLPTSSTGQKIIGATSTRTGIVLFTTDDLGFDCVWNIENVIQDNYTLDLIYFRNLNFSTGRPIQALFNFENEDIQKVYWVDGAAQIRFLNLKHENIEGNGLLLDIPSTAIDFVGTVDFSQPVVTDIVGGGTHTAGVVQYAYNLYRLNSSQTKLSPLSELVPLAAGGKEGGGDLNEVVGAVPVVTINDIDQSYTNIKVYAIKYTSLNQLPQISLIEERELDSTSITVYDDGNTIEDLTIEEFIFLGSDPIIARHIETKDNRLFLADIATNDFILPEILDFRAYGHTSGEIAVVHSDIRPSPTGQPTGTSRTLNTTTYELAKNHDAVNLRYDTRKFQKNGITLGGEGKYLKYEIVQKTAGQLTEDVEDYKFLKDEEVYRIGIVMYNRLGQESLPQWVADFQAPKGNLQGNYNTLKVELKADFYTWLNTFTFASEDNRPVGYRVIRAERNFSDRTILTQGPINGMMVNVLRDGVSDPTLTESERRTASDQNPKLPNFLMRTFKTAVANDGQSPLQKNDHLLPMMFRNNDPTNQTNPNSTVSPGTEVQFDIGERAADTFQHNTMMQLYSPEVFFLNLPLTSGLEIKVKGMARTQGNYTWFQGRQVVTRVADQEIKIIQGLHPKYPKSGVSDIDTLTGNVNNIYDRGLIYNPNSDDDENRMAFSQWYRDLTGWDENNNNTTSIIYGAPELTQRGQGRTIYNRNPKYEYSNTLEGFVTDGNDDFADDQMGLVSLNSFGTRCLTMVLGGETTSSWSRPSLNTLYTQSSLGNPEGALVVEIRKNPNDKYLGNIYGGVSFEDKKRTGYLAIGQYQDIATTSVQIDNPGDTYVQRFNFLRIGKTDSEIYQYNINQVSELVSCVLETTIDLKNRNDISGFTWDSEFQPRDEDYHRYNTVYSQQSNLVKSIDVDFTFRRIKQFDTRIQSTKAKLPNESIDSWTDILVNEIMDLNGRFGPINNIIEFNDNLYAFQDEAIAAISINPRVQVQGSDGVGIELGTGGILYDFNYLTTKSGSINKWGMTQTKTGIYYYDALNKGVGKVPNAMFPLLSDAKGLHTFFNKNYNYTSIATDNPVLGAGAVVGYDNYNNDVYFTLLQGADSFTWVFNELQDQFVDRKLYFPSKYIYKGEKLISLSNDSTQGYEHYAGQYNVYHGVNRPSTITLQVNPESDLDTVFNNIFYNSEVYLNDIDQPNTTLTHITAYNEYQNSGRIPLVSGRSSNLRRKFREWKANIPREGRNRIRNPWIFLKLEFDNASNYKMILHDIIVSYTV